MTLILLVPPPTGTNEDPVTGSVHTTLIPYWSTVLKKNDMTAKQLHQRGGVLICQNLGNRVLISGNAISYLEGIIQV
ncbi:MAG: putative PhzF superfamily epimerase YddE/YHI9 [Arcticibacterium sp.]|jgi:predicted PhzF superfamily epimerase YddE/YHI9